MMDLEEWVDENMAFIVYQANKGEDMNNFPRHIDKFDLMQEACIAVARAWDSYDKSKGEFMSYALQYIKNRFIKLNPNIYMKNGEIHKKNKHENTTIIADGHTPSKKPENDYEETLSILYRGIKEQLNNRQYKALTAFYGLFNKEEKTYKEIGKNFGLTKQRIEQIISEAEDKLRSWLLDHGVGKEVLAYEKA